MMSSRQNSTAAAMAWWLVAAGSASMGCQWLLSIDPDVPILDAGIAAADSGVETSDTGAGDGTIHIDAAVDIDVAGAEACASSDLNTDPFNCGACGHDCLGGGCTLGVCQPLVLAVDPLGVGIMDVAIDDTSIFWGNGDSAVGRVSKSGGDAQLVITGLDGAPVSLAVDGQRLFVSTGNSVYAFNKDGFGPVLVGSPTLGFNLVVEPSAVDWAAENITEGGVNLMRALFDADGGFRAPQLIVTNLAGLAFATDGVNVFWGQYGAISCEDSAQVRILRARLAGDASPTPLVTCHTLGATTRQIAVDATHVAWFDSCNDAIWVAPKDASVPDDSGCLSGAARQLAAGPLLGRGSLTLASDRIVWTSTIDGAVRAVAADGSCTESACVRTLATGRNEPLWIVADEHAAYWAEGSPAGQIVKVAF
jgi:hypothetical protein